MKLSKFQSPLYRVNVEIICLLHLSLLMTVSIPFISGQCWNNGFRNVTDFAKFQSPLYRVNVEILKKLKLKWIMTMFQSPLYRVNVEMRVSNQLSKYYGFQSPLYRVNVEIISVHLLIMQSLMFQSPLYRVNVEISWEVCNDLHIISFNPLYIGSMLKSLWLC